MKNKNGLMAVAGGALLACGCVVLKIAADAQGLVLPYILIGLGCGLFGHGAGEIMAGKSRDSARSKQIKIAQNDERNAALCDKAKAKAYDMMLYVFGTLLIAFALMGVDAAVTLLLVIAYLAVVGVHIYYFGKYQKEM